LGAEKEVATHFSQPVTAQPELTSQHAEIVSSMVQHLQNISKGTDSRGKDAKNAERIIRSAINVSGQQLPLVTCFWRAGYSAERESV